MLEHLPDSWMMTSFWNHHRPFEVVHLATRMDHWSKCECGAPRKHDCNMIARRILDELSPELGDLN
jgi:hypothetical protein